MRFVRERERENGRENDQQGINWGKHCVEFSTQYFNYCVENSTQQARYIFGGTIASNNRRKKNSLLITKDIIYIAPNIRRNIIFFVFYLIFLTRKEKDRSFETFASNLR